ncbi:MAG: hypothetical protein ACMXYC_00195 [Candidatus Woesearchaeota archaeon]
MVYAKSYNSIREDKTLLQRAHIWKLIQMYMDLSYFTWKLDNWKTDVKSILPKKIYKDGKAKLIDMMDRLMR